jgi:YihY family inner membrane protein
MPPRGADLLRAFRSALLLLGRAVTAFRRNQGLLLSGAVAYYTLISLVPLFVVLLVVLSHLIDEASLLSTVRQNLELVLPGQAAGITAQVGAFLEHRPVVGLVGGAVLLLFSGMAFAVLERAMSVIFFHRVQAQRRHAVVSAVLPYLFVGALGVGLVVVTLISGALDVVGRDSVAVLGHEFALAGLARGLLHAVGFIGLALLLTALYLVLPHGRLSLRHALVGGVTATALWEVTRSILVWYLARLSMIDVVYGSLADRALRRAGHRRARASAGRAVRDVLRLSGRSPPTPRRVALLVRQEPCLGLEPARVAGERASRPDHTVARDDDRERVLAVGGPDRAHRLGPAERARDVRVRARLAEGDPCEHGPDGTLERGATGRERQVEGSPGAGEIRRELRAGLGERRARRVDVDRARARGSGVRAEEHADERAALLDERDGADRRVERERDALGRSAVSCAVLVALRVV